VAASFQLLVSPVNNLSALVVRGTAPALSWTSSDPTVTGYNLYRNASSRMLPTDAPAYADNLPLTTSRPTV